MKDKLISVIVPIYNSEKYLNKCIDSIIDQTYKNLEIILVDDGSPDNCPTICDDYSKKDSRIIVIHKQNGGVSSARNAGLERATGEFISFVDSDDYIKNDMYENMIAYQNKYNADIVKCAFSYVISEVIKPRDLTYDSTLYNLLDPVEKNDFYNMFGQVKLFTELWTYFINSKIAKSIKFDENYAFGEDLLYIVNCFGKAKNVYISTDSFYYYNYIDNSAANSSKNVIRNLNNIISVNYDICSLLDKAYISYFCSLNFIAVYRCIEKAYFNNSLKETVNSIDDCNKLEFLMNNMEKGSLSFFQKLFFYSLKNKNIFLLNLLFNIKKLLLRNNN